MPIGFYLFIIYYFILFYYIFFRVDIVKELIDKFHMEINKNKVKNQQKTQFFFFFMNAMTYLKKD